MFQMSLAWNWCRSSTVFKFWWNKFTFVWLKLDNRCWLVASGRRRERLPLRSMKEVNQSFPAMLFLDQDAGNWQLKWTASSKANFLT